MQRLHSSGIPALFTILALGLALGLVPACKDDKPAADAASTGEPAAAATTGDPGAATAAGEAQSDEAGEDPSGAGAEAGPAAEAGAEAEAEAGGDDAGEAEPEAEPAGAAEAGAAEAESVVPGLYEQAKSLDTSDDAAKQALADAIAAGATKIDAAKIGNARGESLMAAGEGERAAVFFEWAADTHKLYSEPVYNLATLSAYAGDLEIAKEHLQELQKRGNKKLMKKVGVDPAFALLHDDADVRKIYEQ